MTTVKREDFLGLLQSVSPGLSQRETIEQSNCFIFRDGSVATFNEETACRQAVPVDFTAAVPAAPLMDLLNRLNEETVNVEYGDGELVVSGKHRKAGIRADAEISLPLEHVEAPGDWKPLPEGFSEAVGICQQCVGKDASKYYLTCVHLHPKWIEASDEIQITRFRMRTGIEEECLLNRDSIRNVVDTGVKRFSETPTWFHFQNEAGLVLSCRRYLMDYPSDEITKYLKSPGQPVTLPKGLQEAAERAQVFSKDNADSNQVLVELKAGKARIKGTGVSGWYEELTKVKYQGDPLSFLISPAVLIEILKTHSDVLVCDGILRVDAGKLQYCSCLGVVDAVEEAELEPVGAE